MPVLYAASRIAGGSGPAGTAPGAPTNVTSITKDAGATVSFRPPSSLGSSPIISYTVTPYIGASAQAPTTVAVGSLGSITNQSGTAFKQATVTGLTNSTAYTFTVKATNTQATGPESAASGANTPLAGLVFGDDFGGAANGDIDPEWYIYNRCGFIAQSEVEWYLPSQVALDGSSKLKLMATKTAHSGPSYPSDGNTVRNQTWLSGACQSNTRTYVPSTGNTMTFEVSQQVCPDIGGGMWPGLFWLEGFTYLNAWKTDPQQSGWDNAGQSEIDVAEWNPTQVFDPTDYQNNSYGGSQVFTPINTSTDFSAAQHVYQVKWKPGVSNTFFRDGTQTHQDLNASGAVASTSGAFFLLLYLQIIAGSATADNTCYIDYVRVYDQ